MGKVNNRPLNPNLFKIESVENMVMRAILQITELTAKTAAQKTHKNDAIEALNEMQTKELYQLRKAFER